MCHFLENGGGVKVGRDTVHLSREDLTERCDWACWDWRVKRGALTLARSVLLLTFRRLHIPFLCGEADVDWLAFLP